MRQEPPIPVLSVFDAALARAFCADWLGFEVDGEMDAIDPLGNRLRFDRPPANA